MTFDAKKIKNDIVSWIRKYFEENGPDSKAVIGISGGKDSSIVAALCVEAIGAERVLGVLMPQGSQYDIQVSYDLCKHLGINFIEIDIGEAVDAIIGGINYSAICKDGIPDTEDVDEHVFASKQAIYNIPARIRMTVLYGVSASVGGRVANTSNLSEDWVGWVTKFGDGAGDFSPLMKLTVTEVLQVGRECNLPDEFIEKVPEDGLTGRTDEDNLGFTYKCLDDYIRKNPDTDIDEETAQKIDKLHGYNLHKLQPMPHFDF